MITVNVLEGIDARSKKTDEKNEMLSSTSHTQGVCYVVLLLFSKPFFLNPVLPKNCCIIF